MGAGRTCLLDAPSLTCHRTPPPSRRSTETAAAAPWHANTGNASAPLASGSVSAAAVAPGRRQSGHPPPRVPTVCAVGLSPGTYDSVQGGPDGVVWACLQKPTPLRRSYTALHRKVGTGCWSHCSGCSSRLLYSPFARHFQMVMAAARRCGHSFASRLVASRCMDPCPVQRRRWGLPPH